MDPAAVVQELVADFKVDAAAAERVVTLTTEPAGPPRASTGRIGRGIGTCSRTPSKYSAHEPGCIGQRQRGGRWRDGERPRRRSRHPARHEQEQIFKKFVRGASSRTDGIKGTGIGLAMVRHIVDAHGGTVSVDSAPGRGSTFTILLP